MTQPPTPQPPASPSPIPPVEAPATPSQPTQAVVQATDNLTVFNLVLGILAMSTFFTFGGILFGLPGLIMGFVNLKHTTNHTINTVGIALNVLAFVLSVLFLIFIFWGIAHESQQTNQPIQSEVIPQT